MERVLADVASRARFGASEVKAELSKLQLGFDWGEGKFNTVLTSDQLHSVCNRVVVPFAFPALCSAEVRLIGLDRREPSCVLRRVSQHPILSHCVPPPTTTTPEPTSSVVARRSPTAPRATRSQRVRCIRWLRCSRRACPMRCGTQGSTGCTLRWWTTRRTWIPSSGRSRLSIKM